MRCNSSFVLVLLLVLMKDVDAECSQLNPDAAIEVMQSTLLKMIQAVSDLTHIVTKQTKEHGQIIKECPVPFINIMDQCFYINMIQSLDFESARNSCQAMGADLAQPKYPQALRAYIWDTLGDKFSKFKLGGSDLLEEGDWRWLSGESITEGWSPGQPDDHRGQQECLHLQSSLSYKLPFDDWFCESGTYFICEYIR
ncbi:unnamed protein product [Meganyctiphanes norvegica]|uniref:C-type lectin domain-containing protein n=1 Tax=Meganyctiphanes norvegica TaxID=48144 RepID=A0AAV2QFT1_MEGNR